MIEIGQIYKQKRNDTYTEITCINYSEGIFGYKFYREHDKGFTPYENCSIDIFEKQINDGDYILMEDKKEFFDENVNRLSLVDGD